MFFSLLHFLSLGFLLLPFIFSLILNKKNFNGPKGHPFIGCLVAFYQNRFRLLDWFTDLLSLSPTQTIVINRLGANRIVLTANPLNVEHILKANFDNYPKGNPFTELLGDFLGMGIFNVDGQLWSSQRKLASHEFTTNSLREFVVKVLEEETQDRLFPLLEQAAERGVILDMQEVLKRFTFDTICKVSLGFDPCYLDLSRPIPPLAEAFDLAADASAARGREPINAIWKVKRLLNVGSEKKLKEAVRMVHGFVNEIIRERVNKNGSESQNGNDLLSRFITSGCSDEMVRDMVISFLMAGKDTTSAAMTPLFWLLTCKRDIEMEILEEVKSIFVNGEGEKNSLAFEDLKKMDYLKACLCESMRLYPPVVWDSKHAAKDDVLPDGTPVFKGNRVTYFPYGMGRMENLWGKDCLEFRPNRWYAEPGVLWMESPYKFAVFQAGPRVCLGKEMAFIQMKYVVASVLRRFEFKPVSSDLPVIVPSMTAHMAGGLKVRVHMRSV